MLQCSNRRLFEQQGCVMGVEKEIQSSCLMSKPVQQMTVRQMLNVVLLWPIQTLFMAQAITQGIGYIYVIIWVMMLSGLSYLHYYEVMRGKKVYCISSIVDYPITMMFGFSLPMLCAASYLVFFHHQDWARDVTNRNPDLMQWIKSFHFLYGIKFMDAGNPLHLTIIYTFTLVVLSSILVFFLGVPLWWSMGKDWVWYLDKMDSPHRIFFGMFFLFSFFIYLYGCLTAELGYGFRPVVVVEGAQRFLNNQYADMNLFKGIYTWAAFAACQPCFGAGIVGFFRYVLSSPIKEQ
jgi:hypothetical protein